VQSPERHPGWGAGGGEEERRGKEGKEKGGREGKGDLEKEGWLAVLYPLDLKCTNFEAICLAFC
jgi:hypothetical protein